jgi:hypothetical protein
MSVYEREFNEKMHALGFMRAVMNTYVVTWSTEEALGEEVGEEELKEEVEVGEGQSATGSARKANIGTLADLTSQFTNDLNSLALSQTLYHTNTSEHQQHRPSLSPGGDTVTSTHHIVAYYKPSATSICARCNKHYFPSLQRRGVSNDGSTPAAPTPLSSSGSVSGLGCRHHGGYFVRRWHPAELRLSIDGNGDSLGYYGTGQEG